jgi:hypothetical protein
MELDFEIECILLQVVGRVVHEMGNAARQRDSKPKLILEVVMLQKYELA